MKYFLDTEFVEEPGSIELISIGIVAEDGRKYYAISKEFNIWKAWYRYDWKEKEGTDGHICKDYWIRNNVLKQIFWELLQKDDPVLCQAEYEYCFTYWRFRKLVKKYGVSREDLAKQIKYFIANVPIEQSDGTPEAAMEYNKPEFYAYYADYDWVVFCWIFGRMIDLPEGFPQYCNDLKQLMDEFGLDGDWKEKNCPDPDGEHNALVDAGWNKILYTKIQEAIKKLIKH